MRLFSSVKLAIGGVFGRTGCRILSRLSGTMRTSYFENCLLRIRIIEKELVIIDSLSPKDTTS
jgi:hypothetical protein